MPSSYPDSHTPRHSPPTRPSTIAELAEEAQDNPFDQSKELKHHLRQAEKFRKEGKRLIEAGDLESAFVQFARAATLVLEKLPTHRDYYTILSKQQRHNLGLNGQDILDSLSELKPTLLSRYERWHSKHPNDTTTPSARSVSKSQGAHQDDEQSRRMVADEVYRYKQQREDLRYVEPSQAGPSNAPHDPRKDAALAAARQAATNTGRPSNSDVRFREQQEDMRRREEEIARRHEQSKRYPDPRQREAEEAARAVAHRLGGGNGVLTSAASMPGPSNPSIYQFPQPAPSQGGAYDLYHSSNGPRPSSHLTPQRNQEGPKMMPLESPTRYEGDSTDSEAAPNFNHDWRRGRTPARSPSYPPPVTTTSPPPPESAGIAYPNLMSQHQKTQGYVPSSQSMFIPAHGHTANAAALLFQDKPSKEQLYSSHILPPASTAPPMPGYPYPTVSQPHPPNSRSPYPHPPTAPQTRDSPPETNGAPGLKTVNLPRDCLPRFLAIAKLNTSLNKETCGLLLGKDKGNKFLVSTLLIPKQHSTSDTCTMDEEELVLQFTEERSLITLGWIHTHPSQSCFMSSVDLHTHSGFQRMLPESFAVVCAPKSTPNFGIFRLTDPPGLQTILKCDAKESFHPHPDVPIYTDADRGHVQMKDLHLEIVDLR